MLWLLVAALLTLNFADFATTWLGVTSGKGIEANPSWLMLGGPLSPFALFLKLVAIPGLILAIAWLLTSRSRDMRPALVAILPAATILAATVTNNVMIVTKKVEKIVKKR